MRVIGAFALALTGLGLCLWAGTWFGLALIAAGLILCPKTHEVQPPVMPFRRGRGHGIGFARPYRVSRGNSDWLGLDGRL